MAHPLMQFFAYAHLPPHLQAASAPFGTAASAFDECPGDTCSPEVVPHVAALLDAVAKLPDNCERDMALAKLRTLRAAILAGAGWAKEGALRFLLEAKDCAVRAVLFK